MLSPMLSFLASQHYNTSRVDMNRGLTPHGRVVLEQALIMLLAVVRYMRTDDVKTRAVSQCLSCMVGPPCAPERAG
jgi:hypothetical protein